MSLPAITRLVKGKSYSAVVTATLQGTRIYREVLFEASRDHVAEPFIRHAGAVDQDRVFESTRSGSLPMLVVTGSIQEKDRHAE